MPPLSEVQRLLREAIVEGKPSAIVPLLVGAPIPPDASQFIADITSKAS